MSGETKAVAERHPGAYGVWVTDPTRPSDGLRETGLVLTVPELAGLVDRWRLPTVPAAALGAPAHVTVLYPWLPGPVTDEALTQLRAAVTAVAPVTLTFGRLGTFPSGVLYLRPEPEDDVRHLTAAVQAAFPHCLPYSGAFPDPLPHLTIALTDPPVLPALEREVRKALAADLPVTATITHLTVLEQRPDGRWSEAHEVGLGP